MFSNSLPKSRSGVSTHSSMKYLKCQFGNLSDIDNPSIRVGQNPVSGIYGIIYANA